ncbi:RNA 2'-phosphotransferase [Microbulbifer sp. JMSA004]|uniref:RNA 2'-phosphotransferase n=1 Tax=Microbulbifer sp. JMSA004 TaxID=3243370 RepID=UPI00403964B4
MSKELNKISKYLSFLLRHEPQAIGLEIDENGWASIQELIDKTTDFELSRNIIEVVVETNDKQRFNISNDGLSIRANQGHSIKIDLNLQLQEPPKELLHGTAARFIEAILKTGLNKRERHHVHLTESQAVAQNVGSRYGKPVILSIASKKMHENGYKFYKSSNNVWLVDCVPVKYIKMM